MLLRWCYYAGLILDRAGKFAQAEQVLREAIERGPKNFDYSDALAILYLESGRLEKSLAEARRVETLVPFLAVEQQRVQEFQHRCQHRSTAGNNRNNFKGTLAMRDDNVRRLMVSEGATHHRSFYPRRLILIVYAAALFFTTHNPLVHAESAEETSWFDGLLMGLVRFGHDLRLERPDKWFHLAAFMVLGLLAFWTAAARQKTTFADRRWMTGGWMIVLGLLLWGWLDEATQPFFGRHFDWNDYLANAVGIFLAAFFAAILYAMRRIRCTVGSGMTTG